MVAPTIRPVFKDRVKEQVAHTGTGAVSLSGATTPTGFTAWLDSFPAVPASGYYGSIPGISEYRVCYSIVDTITGDWETGIGVYTPGDNDIARPATVIANSLGTTGVVNFDPGLKDVFCTLPSAVAQSVLEHTWRPVVAEDDMTFYVRTVPDGGDNSLDGMSIPESWATLEYAWDWIVKNVDCQGHDIRIQLAAGEYPGIVIGPEYPLNCGRIHILGASTGSAARTTSLTGTTPLRVLGSDDNYAATQKMTSSAKHIFIRDLALLANGNDYSLLAIDAPQITLFRVDMLDFFAAAVYAVNSTLTFTDRVGFASGELPDSVLELYGSTVRVKDAESFHHVGDLYASLTMGIQVAGVYADVGSKMFFEAASGTFDDAGVSTTSTGTRYNIARGSSIYLGTLAEATVLPGSTAGSAISGSGVY